MNVQKNDDHNSSFFAKKEAELLAMKKQQAELAEKLFPLTPLPPLPPWANSLEIEEKKKLLQAEIEAGQQNRQQFLDTQIQARKLSFQMHQNEIVAKETQLKEQAKTLSPADSFAQEKQLIAAKSQTMASEAQRITDLIHQAEQFFHQGDH